MAQFLVALILQLVMSPQIPLIASDYGKDVKAGIDLFLAENGQLLADHGVDASGLKDAASNFVEAAEAFHSTYQTNIPALELLGYEENQFLLNFLIKPCLL